VVVPSGEVDPVESGGVPIPPKSVLKAIILGACQLTLTIDDMPSQQYDLKQGDQVEWIGERYFALEMTNASAVQVELNGKLLSSLGRSGDAATVVITADGRIH
jgi:cytoskeleton protein RodZ